MSMSMNLAISKDELTKPALYSYKTQYVFDDRGGRGCIRSYAMLEL